MTAEAAGGPDPPRRVLLVDDHPIVRQGLRRLLELQPDLAVCAEAGSAAEARTLLGRARPDALVVDLSLGEGDGLELVKEARARDPRLPILVLSMLDEGVYAARLLAAGANGYVMKQAASEQFLTALRRVLAGGTWVSETVAGALLRRHAGGPAAAPDSPVAALSDRELQVLQMIGRGLATREVAEALQLSIKTVESHRQRIKRKLGLASSPQLVQYAVTWLAGHDRP